MVTDSGQELAGPLNSHGGIAGGEVTQIERDKPGAPLPHGCDQYREIRRIRLSRMLGKLLFEWIIDDSKASLDQHTKEGGRPGNLRFDGTLYLAYYLPTGHRLDQCDLSEPEDRPGGARMFESK